MKGNAETRVAGLQSRARLGVARRHVIQLDDVGGVVVIAGGGFAGDSRFDPLQARLDMPEQGDMVRYHRTVSVIWIVGLNFDAVAAAFCIGALLTLLFRGALLLVR